MSFQISSDNRGPVPILMCWECNSPIMDLNRGTVFWKPVDDSEKDEDDDIGESDPYAVFLHKGECSRKFDAIHRAFGNYLHSMEVTQFFEAWFEGSQFCSYDRSEAQRKLEMIRNLGET